MLARLVVGLLVLKVAAASPARHPRQVELDTYDENNYDVDGDNVNLENQDVYDYYDGVTIDEPQVREKRCPQDFCGLWPSRASIA